MNLPSQVPSARQPILKQLAVLLLVIFNAGLSFWLWTNEFRSGNNTLVYLRSYFHGNVWTPTTAVPICFLLSLTLSAVLFLFPGKGKARGRWIGFGLIFALEFVAFYVFRSILVDTLRGFIQLPIVAFGWGLIMILPLFCLLTRLVINRFVMGTGWIYVLWLWLAVVATIPLSLACLFVLNGFELTNDWYLLTSVQKGYPVFWIHIVVAATSYLYFRLQNPSASAP